MSTLGPHEGDPEPKKEGGRMEKHEHSLQSDF